MMYNAKVAVCFEIRTKHSTQSEHRVEFFDCQNWWYVEKSLGLKGLINDDVNVMHGTYSIKVSPIHSFTEERKTRHILDRPTLMHVLCLRKYKGSSFCLVETAL